MVAAALALPATSTAIGDTRFRSNAFSLGALFVVVGAIALLFAKFVLLPGTANAPPTVKLAALTSATTGSTPTLDALGAAKATNAVEATVNAARTQILVQGET